jgi:hypothetical protein
VEGWKAERLESRKKAVVLPLKLQDPLPQRHADNKPLRHQIVRMPLRSGVKKNFANLAIDSSLTSSLPAVCRINFNSRSTQHFGDASGWLAREQLSILTGVKFSGPR